MPTISMFGGMKIAVFYNDHLPPHFHVAYNDYITRIEIKTGEYLKGDEPLPRSKEKDILEWLDKYQGQIMDAWNDCQAKPKRQPNKVPPLY